MVGNKSLLHKISLRQVDLILILQHHGDSEASSHGLDALSLDSRADLTGNGLGLAVKQQIDPQDLLRI